MKRCGERSTVPGKAASALRKSGGYTLRLQNFLPHAVDRDPSERLCHHGQRADDIEFARAQHFMQRKGRILAARPRDQCFRACQ